jgi:hypothetical protein
MGIKGYQIVTCSKEKQTSTEFPSYSINTATTIAIVNTNFPVASYATLAPELGFAVEVLLELLEPLELDEPDELDEIEPMTPPWTTAGVTEEFTFAAAVL